MNAMQTVDKSVAISQLKLNRDVQEHIKGYLFYDKEQVFLRREKKKYVNEIKNAISQKLLDEISAHWCFGSGTTSSKRSFVLVEVIFGLIQNHDVILCDVISLYNVYGLFQA
jgi:hypothetical protein